MGIATLEQEIADLKNKLARKEEAQPKLADVQQIIIGGMMLALAERDDAARKPSSSYSKSTSPAMPTCAASSPSSPS